MPTSQVWNREFNHNTAKKNTKSYNKNNSTQFTLRICSWKISNNNCTHLLVFSGDWVQDPCEHQNPQMLMSLTQNGVAFVHNLCTFSFIHEIISTLLILHNAMQILWKQLFHCIVYGIMTTNLAVRVQYSYIKKLFFICYWLNPRTEREDCREERTCAIVLMGSQWAWVYMEHYFYLNYWETNYSFSEFISQEWMRCILGTQC
jgi:hypothetical protein